MRPPRRRRGSDPSDPSSSDPIDLCGRAAAGAERSSDRWDDPRRLIEAYFVGRRYREHDPETAIIAWLSILPAGIEPARAACSLVARLSVIAPEAPSARQRRLLDLLLHVSRRGRAAPNHSTTTRKRDP